MRFGWPTLIAVAALAGLAARAEGAVTFLDETTPANGTHVGQQVAVFVVTSERVGRVEARIETRSADLQSVDGQLWNGELSLKGLSHGPKELVLTAHPATGALVSKVIKIVRNDVPRIVVRTPVEGDVARPAMRLAADCVDDEDPRACALTVRNEADPSKQVLASGRERLDTSVSLARWDGQVVSLIFEARDADGGFASVQVSQVFVDGSPRLVEVDRGAAAVVDGDARRTVFCGPVGGLQVRDRQSGGLAPIRTDPPDCSMPVLTQHGLLYPAQDPPSMIRFMLWDQKGERLLRSIMSPGPAPPLTVAGDFVSWSATDQSIEVVDLRTFGSRTIGLGEGGPRPPIMATNARGDVAYVDGVDFGTARSRTILFRSLADGTVEKVHEIPDLETNFWAVADDAVNLAYTANLPTNTGFEIYLHQAGGDVLLLRVVFGPPGSGSGGFDKSPENLVRLAGGFVAHIAIGPRPSIQLLLRSPAGSSALIHEGPLGEVPLIEGLSPTGDLVFLTSGGRMLSRGGGAPERVSSALGKPVFRDGAWFILMGTSLLHVKGTGAEEQIAVYHPPADEPRAPSQDGGGAAGTTDAPASTGAASGGGCSCRAAGGRGPGPFPTLLACVFILVAVGRPALRRRSVSSARRQFPYTTSSDEST